MLRFLRPPSEKFSNHFEKAKFNLTWNYNLMLMVLLMGLSLAFLINDVKTFYPTFAGFIITVVFFLWIRKSKEYKVVATVFSYIGAILMILTLLLIKDEFHFIDTLWAVVISLFAFFAISRVHAFVVFASQFVAIIYFLSFEVNNNIRIIGKINQNDLTTMVINFTLCSTMFVYIVFQFIKVFNQAQIESDKANFELTKQNQLIQNQNEEKTVMLQEIHHRVKNNLQVITSLLRLQAKEVQDPKSLESFKDAVNRVVAMALIHEKMYQEKNFDRIHLKSYLESLIHDLIHSYAIATPIETQVDSTVSSINQEKLVPFALIINELVSNSLKHAFDSVKNGKVSITITADDNIMHVNYQDNGTWKSVYQEQSFGLEMIDILTEQLDGTYTLEKESFTKYSFQLSTHPFIK